MGRVVTGRVTLTCRECPSPLGRGNRSGICRVCCLRRLNTDALVEARRRAGVRQHYADPENIAAAQARGKAMSLNLSPEERQRRRERGLALGRTNLRAANAAMTAETRAENGRKRSATVLAWCPPEWRDKYRDLKQRGRKAAVAKRMVLDLIAGRPVPVPYARQKSKLDWCPPSRRDEYRELQKAVGAVEARRVLEADLTPFERQLARVAAGAKLVMKPVFRRPDHAFTLGGVSPEAM